MKQAAFRLLEENKRFRAAFREGMAAAGPGDFVEHEQAEIEQIPRS